jgi:hypothetical protein
MGRNRYGDKSPPNLGPPLRRPVQSFVGRLGLVLCVAALGLSVVLHIATFMTIVPFLWFLLPLFLLGGSVLCAQAIGSAELFGKPSGVLGWLFFLSLFYAAFILVHVFRTTGGASSVDIVNGEYVYKYKARILRTITEQEYRMFPNLVVRALSALIAVGAFSRWKQFTSINTAAPTL